ncbi:hypothetical protein D3C81_1942520 [compost metagenome]
MQQVVLPEQLNFALVGIDHAHNHFDEACFACPIRTDQPRDIPFLDANRNIAQFKSVVAFTQTLQLNDFTHSFSSS